MDRGHQRQIPVLEHFAAVARQKKRRAQQRLGRRRTQRHQQSRAYRSEFRVQPWEAGPHVLDSGSAVTADLALAPEPEMLHHISDIDVSPRYSGPLQGSVEHPASWPDERLTRDVFPVAGLLADQDHRGLGMS